MGDSQEVTTSKSANDAVNDLTTQIAGDVSSVLEPGPKVFGKSLYGGQGDLTKQGMDTMIAAANNPWLTNSLNNAMGYTGKLAGGGGLNTAQKRGFSSIIDPGGRGFSANIGAGQRGFSSTVNPGQRGYDLTVNPGAKRGYETLRQGVIDDTQMAANRTFASEGTFGAGRHRQSLGRGISRAVAGMDYQNYMNDIGLQERDIGRQEGARRYDAGLQERNIGRQENTFLSDRALKERNFTRQEDVFRSDRALKERNIGRQEDAYQSDLNQRQLDFAQQERAMAAMPGLYNASLLPGQTLLETGRMQDADTQAKLLAEQDLFRRTNDAELNQLSRAANVLGKTSAAGGTTTTAPGTPWWQQALGYGTTLIGSAIGGGL